MRDITVIAEFIVEFFYDQSIDKVTHIWGVRANKALRILEEIGLARIKNEKVVLTKIGEKFLDLPTG